MVCNYVVLPTNKIQYSSGGQENYNYTTAAYQTAVPQYTQAQINQYYAQYQCYPPQPYTLMPEYYGQQGHAVAGAYQQPTTGVEYESPQWQHPEGLEVATSGPTR